MGTIHITKELNEQLREEAYSLGLSIENFADMKLSKTLNIKSALREKVLRLEKLLREKDTKLEIYKQTIINLNKRIIKQNLEIQKLKDVR